MGEFSIQLSPALLNQLIEDGEKSKRRTRRSKSKVSRQPRKPQSNQKQVASHDSGEQKAPAASGWPVHPPLFLPVTPPAYSVSSELEAIRSVVNESEKVVEKLRKHEEEKLKEVTQKAKDLHEKEFKLPEPKHMPCSTENDGLIACYKENGDNPMKCSHLAYTFADCARRMRQLVSSAEK